MTNYAKIIALCGRRFLSGALVSAGAEQGHAGAQFSR